MSPEYYKADTPGPDGEDELFGFHHLNHCVDAIRQSLMCNPDITPLVWQWSDEAQRQIPRANVLHTCRDFSHIQSWARNHQAPPDHMDTRAREMDDPLDPSTWTESYRGE